MNLLFIYTMNVIPHPATARGAEAPRPFPEKLPELEYPDDFAIRKIHGHGCFIWRSKHVFLSRVLVHERVALEPLGDGLYSVFFGPLLLARFDERESRINK
jgi:putative transposase